MGVSIAPLVYSFLTKFLRNFFFHPLAKTRLWLDASSHPSFYPRLHHQCRCHRQTPAHLAKLDVRFGAVALLACWPISRREPRAVDSFRVDRGDSGESSLEAWSCGADHLSWSLVVRLLQCPQTRRMVVAAGIQFFECPASLLRGGVGRGREAVPLDFGSLAHSRLSPFRRQAGVYGEAGRWDSARRIERSAYLTPDSPIPTIGLFGDCFDEGSYSPSSQSRRL